MTWRMQCSIWWHVNNTTTRVTPCYLSCMMLLIFNPAHGICNPGSLRTKSMVVWLIAALPPVLWKTLTLPQTTQKVKPAKNNYAKCNQQWTMYCGWESPLHHICWDRHLPQGNQNVHKGAWNGKQSNRKHKPRYKLDLWHAGVIGFILGQQPVYP